MKQKTYGEMCKQSGDKNVATGVVKISGQSEERTVITNRQINCKIC